MPNLVAQVKLAENDGRTALVADLYDAKFCTPAETVSLLHFDDADNPMKDECGNIWKKNTSSVAGEVIINTSAGKFGNGCLQIVPAGKQVIPYSLNPIFFGGRDFTFDFWASGDIVFYTNDKDNINVAEIHFAIGKSNFSIGNTAYSPYSNLSNTLSHYAFVYNHSAKQLKIYLNGVLKGTFGSFNCTYQSRRVFFLTYAATNTAYPPRVDEFRFVDGLQVWTSNFTPPTEPYKLVDGHIPCRLKGSNQRLWAPFNFIKTDLTPADSDTT